MARVLTHAEAEEVADDITHPIPALKAIDVSGTEKAGGADLFIIIATPLDFSPRSQNRLLDKIEGYLRYISSEEFMAEAAPATADDTAIMVEIHAKSDTRVFELLERCRPWVAESNAHLTVVRGKQDQH